MTLETLVQQSNVMTNTMFFSIMSVKQPITTTLKNASTNHNSKNKRSSLSQVMILVPEHFAVLDFSSCFSSSSSSSSSSSFSSSSSSSSSCCCCCCCCSSSSSSSSSFLSSSSLSFSSSPSFFSFLFFLLNQRETLAWHVFLLMNQRSTITFTTIFAFRSALADVYKNDGNDHLIKKEFTSAISSYTEGIKVDCKDDGMNAKLYSNRATAHFYLGRKKVKFIVNIKLKHQHCSLLLPIPKEKRDPPN